MENNKEYYNKLKSDYELVFSTSEGKRVIKDILAGAFINKTTFVAGDTHKTAFNEGERNLALHINYMATKAPESEQSNNAPKAIT